ncbi:MAG: hypothetical protein ACREQO_08670 [Candidatus Binatia bacterium]
MPSEHPRHGKLMLVGLDRDQILEKRFQAANWQVVTVGDSQSAVDHARHELFDVAVVISRGSLINVAETIFNLRDIHRSMEIVVIVERLGDHASRPLRQLIEHPVERTRILTRRQLQKQIPELLRQAPAGSRL